MDFTIIVLGRLEYANQRSVKQALTTITHLLETRYKNEVLYRDVEDIVDIEQCALILPRKKFQSSEKLWQNTVHMLAKAADFAIAGDLNMWRVRDGELQEYCRLEPNNDKSTVTAFRQGRELINSGDMEQAMERLNFAINRFDRHAQALERRGFIHYLQGNTTEALADYAASIAIDTKRPEAYLGRAKIYIDQEQWKEALADLTTSMKHSMPHHNIYLEALHRKGKCEMELGEFAKAIASFNFFLTRPLLPEHPQFIFRRQVSFDKGRALAASGDLKEAVKCFDDALEMPPRDGKPDRAVILVHRGMAAKKCGLSDYKANWQEAADEGSTEAAKLLASVA